MMHLFKEAQKEIRFFFVLFMFNLRNAAELRGSFLIQVFGMFLNNFAFLILWIFFFRVFGEVNGWSATEVIGLQGFIALIYGLAFTFAGGSRHLATIVNNGAFDALLIGPRSLYLRILSSKLGLSASGDILYGILLVVIFLAVGNLSILGGILLILSILPAVMLLTNIALTTSLVAFLIPDSDMLARSWFELFFAPSLYPGGLFSGFMRSFFLFIVPALVIGSFPIELAKEPSLIGIFFIWLISLCWHIATLILLQLAVRKYESGNLTGAR